LGLTWDEAKKSEDTVKSGDTVLPDVLPEHVDGLRSKVRSVYKLLLKYAAFTERQSTCMDLECNMLARK